MPEALLTLIAQVRAHGWAAYGSDATRALLGLIDDDFWTAFGESWNRLGSDRYMADGGRYRRRRHCVLAFADGRITRLPPRPHFQSRDYNVLNGGIERHFAPVESATLDNPVFIALLGLCLSVFKLGQAVHEIEVHQFRIEAGKNAGLPTPEGMHRDGVDFVGIFLINRCNVEAGTTRISVDGAEQIAEFTLVHPLDAVFLEDHRVRHGVTPITRIDPTRPAWRDVLVLTFKRGAQNATAPASGTK